MKTSNALALSALLVNSLVVAYPSKRHAHEHLHKKRDLVVVTENVYETVYSTTTIWVDPTPAGGEFYEHPAPTHKEVTYEVVPSAASSTAQYVAPSSASVYVAPSSAESPAPSSFTSVASPSSTPAESSSSTPVEASSSVYVAPSSAYVAPSSAEATSTPATSAAATSAASTPSASAAPSSGETYTGDVTYYNPAGGYGACGSNIADSDSVVAIPHGLWDTKGTMSNGNPWCGTTINILNKSTGKTYTAKIADKCMGCDGASLDLTQGLFDEAFPGVDGRGKGVMEWSIAA